MLKIVSQKNSAEKKKALESFDPHTQTWVVSDLKTKFEIQKILLKKHKVLEEDAILRITELWSKFLLKVQPELQVVSKSLMISWIQQWLDEQDIDWAQGPGAPETVFTYMTQFLPILSNPAGVEVTKEWLSQNPTQNSRWGIWFLLCHQFWQEALHEGIISSSWVVGVLGQSPLGHDHWDREIIFDLGPDLTGVEADLILQIGNHQSVKVFEPDVPWSQRYFSSLWAYQLLRGQSLYQSLASNNLQKPQDLQFPENTEFKKYSTMLAEVKSATHWVREKFDQGVAFYRQAIFEPNIELYWPILSEFLEQEGVPAAKSCLVNMQSYPPVLRWLSRLRLNCGITETSDLEMSLYEPEKVFQLNFDRFEHLFSFVYDRFDLKRHSSVAELFSQEVKPTDKMQRDDFALWSLNFWEGSSETLEKVMQRFFQECPTPTKMALRHWIFYLENICARVEDNIKGGVSEGVAIENINAAEWIPGEHVFVLGLMESQTKKQDQGGLLLNDVIRISEELGFHLGLPDKSADEFELLWQLIDSKKKWTLSCAKTDFSGAAEAPSILWLEGCVNKGQDWERVDVASEVRWDEIQKSDILVRGHLRENSEEQTRKLFTALEQDAGEKELESFGEKLTPSLSVSSLESYSQCPFVFASKKLFRLVDLPDLDLDVDRATRGQLMHAIFEKLTQEPMKFDLSDEKIEALIEECRDQKDVPLAEEKLWPPLKLKYLDLAKKFLQKEKLWREKFPETQTVGHETSIRASWSLSSGKLVEEGAGEFKFSGQIDRIDSDGRNNYVLIDYKSSGVSARNHGAWLNNDSYQMGLYSSALESGYTEIPKGKTHGAFYYVAKDLSRDKGLGRKDLDTSLFDNSKRSACLIDEQGLHQLQSALFTRLQSQIENIYSGKMAPEPKKIETCQNCYWRRMCRAPHLN